MSVHISMLGKFNTTLCVCREVQRIETLGRKFSRNIKFRILHYDIVHGKSPLGMRPKAGEGQASLLSLTHLISSRSLFSWFISFHPPAHPRLSFPDLSLTQPLFPYSPPTLWPGGGKGGGERIRFRSLYTIDIWLNAFSLYNMKQGKWCKREVGSEFCRGMQECF